MEYTRKNPVRAIQFNDYNHDEIMDMCKEHAVFKKNQNSTLVYTTVSNGKKSLHYSFPHLLANLVEHSIVKKGEWIIVNEEGVVYLWSNSKIKTQLEITPTKDKKPYNNKPTVKTKVKKITKKTNKKVSK